MAQSRAQTGQEGQLLALEEALQALREAQQIKELIAITLNFLQSEFDYNLIWIGLYDRADQVLVGQGGITPTGEVSFLKQRFNLFPGDLLDQVLVMQRPAGVPDLREENRAGEWRKAAQKFNIQGALVYPIRHRDQCFGLVLMGSHLWGGSPRAEETARLAMLLGALGAALYQIETASQQQKVKRPDQPLLNLLSQIGSLATFEQRLAAIVQVTQQFIAPTRTSVYWFEPERCYFYRRAMNQVRIGASLRQANPSPLEISAQDINGFYQALTMGQVVSVSELEGALNANVPGRLMQLLKLRSLLAAPIQFQAEFLGFLAVEGDTPRIWEEEEKSYLRAVAQLAGLAAPLDKMDQVIAQTQADQALMSGLTQAICNDEDGKLSLKLAAEQLCQRLMVERVLILLHDPDTGQFSVCHQAQGPRKRPLGESLKPLSDLDWQMLERHQSAIAIENLAEDLRLLVWRETLMQLGVRSLLACNTSLGKPLEGVVLVCHDQTRTWNSTECQMVEAVSQQLGLILHQWQLQRQSEQQQKIFLAVQQGQMSIQKTQNLERLEQTALQDIMQILQVPLVALVTWTPGQQQGWVVTPPLPNPKFAIPKDTSIAIQLDPLIQATLRRVQEGVPVDKYAALLLLSVEELAPETRFWLNSAEIGQIAAIALQTDPEYEPSGVLVVADYRDRTWSELELNALVTLVNHFAWAHRSICLTEVLKRGCQRLECLNWYKQGRLEDLYRMLAADTKKLSELLTQQPPAGTELQWQRMARQLQGALAPLPSLIKHEAWQLQANQESMALATLLKRSLGRVERLIKQRQIWSQVHNQANITLTGDIAKIELVLYELLLAACGRSRPGGRLDIWCQPLEHPWLELSLTDNGAIDPRLLIDLHHREHLDLLAPSTLDHPPGRNLKICQTIIQQLGGQMDIFGLEDGRMLSRLTLPIVKQGSEKL